MGLNAPHAVSRLFQGIYHINLFIQAFFQNWNVTTAFPRTTTLILSWIIFCRSSCGMRQEEEPAEHIQLLPKHKVLEAQFNTNENLNGAHLKKIVALLIQSASKLQWMKCQTDLVTSLTWVQGWKGGFVYQLCVPHLYLRIHWVLPGDLSILLAAWQTGGYEMLSVLQQSLDELKRIGVPSTVCAKGKQFYIHIYISVWLNFAFCTFTF